MSDFTPTLDEVRAIYALGTPAHHVSIGGSYAEFDRAIAKIRADAKVEALREAVADLTEVVDGIQSSGSPNPLAWQTGALAMRDRLKARADNLAKP